MQTNLLNHGYGLTSDGLTITCKACGPDNSGVVCTDGTTYFVRLTAPIEDVELVTPTYYTTTLTHELATNNRSEAVRILNSCCGFDIDATTEEF